MLYQRRVICFFYRAGAFSLTLAGLAAGSGFTAPGTAFLYYTTLSNLVYLAFLGYLLLRTAAALAHGGTRGPSDYAPDAAMAVTLVISFTFLIFWTLLAPNCRLFFPEVSLLSFGNLCVHALAPLSAMTDYALFRRPGRLSRRAILLAVLLPSVWVGVVLALGLTQSVVYYTVAGIPRYFPYPFMDFDALGGGAAAGIGIVTAVFVGAALLLYRADCRLAKRRRATK
ncbi:MAG: hypothetical protein LBM78_04345 [Clostridiales bacterium]|jgi:hypothetical protein|nr:hypothetical protein [Clostridiales bacterium]